jgi:acylphosphatase
MQMAKATIIVEGWIQNVGYRAFVKQSASQFALKGLVRNLPSGKVEIFCDGDLDKITQLVEKINFKGKRDGPLSAYVDNLSVYRESEHGYLGPWKDYADFEVDYGIEIQSPADRLIIENLESGKIYFAQINNQFSSFREETSTNFQRMDDKYGSISEEVKKLREFLEKALAVYIEKQK